MATRKPIPSKQGPPLSFMQNLGPTVAYYEPAAPPASTGSPRGADPELIVLLSWMGARDVHIAKYIAQQRALFPSSRILLVRCPFTHSVVTSLNTAGIKSAIAVIRSVIDAKPARQTGKGDPRLLLHVFSNGGMSTAAKLYTMLGSSASIPRHVLILDSCPGYFHYTRTVRALSQAVPWYLGPLMHVLLCLIWLVRLPTLKPPPLDQNANMVNTEELVTRQSRRAYLYGTDDEMVDWQDVEAHAAEASRKGFQVHTEKFQGGKHVAHVRVDSDRYWRIVKATWEQSQGVYKGSLGLS